MQTVIVTGGAGFIGSHTCRALLSRGDRVICIDDFNDYYDPAFKRRNISDLLGNKAFILYTGDIRNREFLENVAYKCRPDKIIHLAARAGVRSSIANFSLYADVNIGGTVNVLDLAAKFAVKKFIFASSSSVYGNSEKFPFSETQTVDYPISPYAATKRAGELICSTYNHLYGLPIICLRFFTVYGPCGRPDMAPYLFIDAIANGHPIHRFGDGSSMRDYTFISDIVAGILASLDTNLNFEIINLGNSQTVSLNAFISAIEKITDKKAIIIEEEKKVGEMDQTAADISKAKRLINFYPVTDIYDGLQKMFEWKTTMENA